MSESLPSPAYFDQMVKDMLERHKRNEALAASAKEFLEAWITAWPDVRGWRFEVGTIREDLGGSGVICDSLVIKTFYCACEKIWMSEDHFHVRDLTLADFRGVMAIRAKTRYDAFAEAASTAIEPDK